MSRDHARLFREWQRQGHRYRRWLAAALAGGAALLIISVHKPAPLPQREVYTATRDLPAGTRLEPGDLRLEPMTEGAIPSGALTPVHAPIGKVLAAPVREGEAITDLRVIGPSLLGQQEGLVAAPVRIADAAAVRLLSVGDVVSVLAAGTGHLRNSAGGHGAARVITPAARVLTLPTPSPGDGAGGFGGALIVLAVTHRTAAELASAAVTDALSVVLRTP